jgi:hypothetical protein
MGQYLLKKAKSAIGNIEFPRAQGWDHGIIAAAVALILTGSGILWSHDERQRNGDWAKQRCDN